MEIINKIKKIKISSKTIAIILGIVFILSILPLIVIGFYNHPSADDYSYSIRTMLALKTGGIIELIKGVFLQIADTYTTWQGTYSAVAVFALQPSVFGQSFYFLSTIILLLAFIGSNYILIKEITLNYLKTSKSVFYSSGLLLVEWFKLLYAILFIVLNCNS